MYAVGVVGPEKSVERIIETGKEMGTNLNLIPLTYYTAIETEQIIKEKDSQMDYFLFSGPIPYEIAVNRFPKKVNKYFYIHLLEAGFYKGLLQIITKATTEIKCLSIDILASSNIIDTTLNQLSTPIQDICVKTFSADIDYNELYDYHAELYHNGKVDAVLTCYPEVMEKLQKDNIPADWISTTKLATKQVLKIIEQRAEISYFKRMQIGVCMIDIDTKVYGNEQQLSYDIQLSTIKMNEELLLLSREINGSFFTIGDGDCMIISSRGEIMDHLPIIYQTIHQLTQSWSRTIKIGIGLGDSALKAEQNARNAIYRSDVENQHIIILDDLGKVITYPFHSETKEMLTSTNKELVKHLENHDISLHSFDRIRSVMERKRKNQFTAHDLALDLNMSKRHAQRLIHSLHQAQLVEQIGEEKISSRGRPRLLYQIKREFINGATC